jgi:formylglycine-generating enzyme required for sulfatase activity
MKKPFRISKYETTQELYEAVTGSNPSRWKGPRNSAESMTILQAEQFCEKLTSLLQEKKLLKPNEKVRLPTEAEWEYCCRAGSKTAYSFGDLATKEGDRENKASILNEYAWHTGNAAGNDPVVGSLKPNPWGLYDMHGYLWEFVSDPFVPQQSDAADSKSKDTDNKNTDKEDPKKEQNKIARRLVRGGSWRDAYPYLTSDTRMPLPENAINDGIGFRCVISE